MCHKWILIIVPMSRVTMCLVFMLVVERVVGLVAGQVVGQVVDQEVLLVLLGLVLRPTVSILPALAAHWVPWNIHHFAHLQERPQERPLLSVHC